MSEILSVKDLQAGYTYRIIDQGNTEFGGCDIESIDFNNLKVTQVAEDNGDVEVENVSWGGDYGDWWVFSVTNTTTFQLVGE